MAVKCISKNGELKQEDIDSLHEEVAVLRSVDHPNIVKLYDFFDEKRYYYMAIELMEGGELFERIVKKTFYNEMDARGLVRISAGCAGVPPSSRASCTATSSPRTCCSSRRSTTLISSWRTSASYVRRRLFSVTAAASRAC